MPAATPRLALPYPTPDDQVDVPRDVEALAEALEAIKNLGMVPQCYLSGTFTANTGGDEAVITDAMILSQVQGMNP
jgi:hypothetical protein